MRQLFAVAIGSILGGLGRHWFSGSLPMPWGTFAVNVIGCFLAGIFSVIAEAKFGPAARVLLLTGFCGAFTTFSAFVLDTDMMLQAGAASKTFVYIFASILLGFVLFRAGILVAGRF